MSYFVVGLTVNKNPFGISAACLRVSGVLVKGIVLYHLTLVSGGIVEGEKGKRRKGNLWQIIHDEGSDQEKES